MKKLLFALSTLALLQLSAIAMAAPGDGFAPGDTCGFVTGVAETYNGGQMLFNSSVPEKNLACIDVNGNFYRDGVKQSLGYHTLHGWIDFAAYSTSSDPMDWASINLTTGEVTGYARMAALPSGNDELWFNWTCDGCTAADYEDRVHVDLATGEFSGYAWNDLVGWVSFNSAAASNLVEVELPPVQVQAFIEITASDSGVTPDNVDLSTAPIADGHEHWRVKAYFIDTLTGKELDQTDITDMEMIVYPTADSRIYLDQISNTGDAIELTAVHPNGAVGCSDSKVCVINEAGMITFNTFIFAGAPTSNMLGIDEGPNDHVNYYSDRDGCAPHIYVESAPPCAGTSFTKAEVFFNRDNERNKLEIQSIVMDITFDTSRSYEVITYEAYGTGGAESASLDYSDDLYVFIPATVERSLSFAPRYRVQAFTADYDGASYTEISSDTSQSDMYLSTSATIEGPSAAYVAAGASTAPADVGFTVYHRVDSDRTGLDQGDYYLLMDSDDPTDDIVDAEARSDGEDGSSTATYEVSYKLGYDQHPSCFDGTPGWTCVDPVTDPTDPTAEQWVCDDISESVFFGPSCYFTAYLPIVDRHVGAENMEIDGAINSLIDEGVLENDSSLSVLGRADVITLRNKMFAQIARYTLGQSAGGGTLDSSMEPTLSSNIVDLIGGNLLFAEGDVTIQGSTSFTDKTLVVLNGDVYVEGNVWNGKLGIIALGDGANLYIGTGVTDVHINAFLDGAVYSYNSDADLSAGYPDWGNEEDWRSALQNQLYWKGSIVSRNTIGGSEASSYDASRGYPVGDGTWTMDEEEALAHDLNSGLRQFQLCYPQDESGNVDTSATPEDCGEGEQRSSYLSTSSDAPFILEYSPASNLPIFIVDSNPIGR